MRLLLRRRPRLAVLGVVLAAAMAVIAPASAAPSRGPSGELVAGAEEGVLRLHDLPPGYMVGDDSSCGPFYPGGGERENGGRLDAFDRWILSYWPEGCGFRYERRYRVAGPGSAPPLVVAETIATPDEEAAATGLSLLLDRSRNSEQNRIGTVPLSPTGPIAHLFRFEDNVTGHNRPASLLIWRQGSLLAMTEVGGFSPAADDSATLRFARLQQGHLQMPSPYTEAERDDTEVPLDDPGLKLPVLWLGHRFQPPAGLPPAELGYTYGSGEGPPGEKFSLDYEGFDLAGWSRASWKRLRRTIIGRINLEAPCKRTTRVPLSRGHAVVYAAYARKHFRICPHRPPDRYYAVAYVAGTVIGVDLALCTGCVSDAGGPYNSARGMKAIVRALTVRPKPDYSAAS